MTTTAETVDGDTTSFIALTAQPGPDGAISLREAMLAANATAPGSNLTIAFKIPTNDTGYDASSGTWKIALSAALPALTRNRVTIDGTTQSHGAVPPIVLDGYNVYEAVGMNNGITILSANIVLRRLTLMNFYDDGILISGATATNNRVVGCYIGTDARGTAAQPNGTGIDIRDGATNTMIGGADSASRNLISGNNWDSGVSIQGSATAYNTVAGNWIGTDASGQAPLGNVGGAVFMMAGVRIGNGAHDNVIGGLDPSLRNVISGNDSGIYIDASAKNTIAGNIIGLAADGQTLLGNINGGVFVIGGAHDNLIGGTTAGAGNIISGNGRPASAFGQGVYISDPNTTNNMIRGNYIGLDVSGIHPGGNYRQGVLIAANAEGNLIGGTGAGAGNVIAYNGLGGIRIDSSSNQVVGNLIGVGADRTTPLGNQYNGVRVFGDNNVIGPDNLISYNQHSGIMLSGSNTYVVSNTLQSNARSGICVLGPGTSIISNTIVYNGGTSGAWPDCNIRGGVVITGTGNTQLTDNTILDNQGAGVTVFNGRDNPILTNSISGNTTIGIQLLYGGNGEIAAPVIKKVDMMEVSGMSCPGCRVEVFTDQSNQGKYFVGTTTAQVDGSFRVPMNPSVLQGLRVTATLTDQQGNTSQFATAIDLPSEPPPPRYQLAMPLLMN